jgi:hypothetical protein
MPALSFCQKDLSMSRGECLSLKLPPKMTRLHNSSSLLRHSPAPQFVDLCQNCESSKDHEQNYI